MSSSSAKEGDRRGAYYGSIADVPGKTPLTDETIIEAAYSNKQVQERRKAEQLVKEAYGDVNGALIRMETTAKELEMIEPKLKPIEKLIKSNYHYNRVRETHDEAAATIQYFRSSKEVSDERRKEAMKALKEYDDMTPAQRRKKYGEEYSIATIMGYKEHPWEL